MTRLYEWCVVTGTGSGRRVSPIGLAGAELEATVRMLTALRAVPDGASARGWVTAMVYLPGDCCYDRYEIRAEAERSQGGTLHLAIGGALVTVDAADDRFTAVAARFTAAPPVDADERPSEPEVWQALRPGAGQR